MDKNFNFTWTGINQSGKKTAGKINAKNKADAITQLTNNTITVLSLKKNYFINASTKKLTTKDKLDFTQQLQLLLQASVPLSDALSLIANTADKDAIRYIAHTLQEKIMSGMSFANALTVFSDYFNSLFCHMISAGEQSGQLDIVLQQLIENQEQQLAIKNKISKALVYPISVLLIAMIISIGLLIFVIPQFGSIYASFGARLPMVTRCLISVSHYLLHQGLFYLFISILIIIGFQRNKKGRTQCKILFLKIPLYRSLLITQDVTQWCQLLTMTLSAGIPMIDALHIANHTLSEPVLMSQMEEAKQLVITGKSLQAALSTCSHFPPRAKTMIAIGENADALPIMLKKVAIYYREKMNTNLDRLSKLIEPVIMLGVASLVSGLIIAMYLPIFRMGSVIG